LTPDSLAGAGAGGALQRRVVACREKASAGVLSRQYGKGGADAGAKMRGGQGR